MPIELDAFTIFNGFVKRGKMFEHENKTDLERDDLEPLVHISNIGPNECRWPIEQFNWCGRRTEGSIYCPIHSARAKSKAQPSGSVHEHRERIPSVISSNLRCLPDPRDADDGESKLLDNDSIHRDLDR